MKKFICLFLVLLLTFFVCGCKGSEKNSEKLKADHWYHYKELDIVNVQNCLVSDAYIKKSGEVSVMYYPVCKSCEETGNLSLASASQNKPLIKTHYCNCGAKTTIKIKIIL